MLRVPKNAFKLSKYISCDDLVTLENTNGQIEYRLWQEKVYLSAKLLAPPTVVILVSGANTYAPMCISNLINQGRFERNTPSLASNYTIFFANWRC